MLFLRWWRVVICIKENDCKFLQLCGQLHASICITMRNYSANVVIGFQYHQKYYFGPQMHTYDKIQKLRSLSLYFGFALQRNLCARMKQYVLFAINTVDSFWGISIFLWWCPERSGHSCFCLWAESSLFFRLRLNCRQVRLCLVEYVVRTVSWLKGELIFKAIYRHSPDRCLLSGFLGLGLGLGELVCKLSNTRCVCCGC